jgi:hypothetical protein
VTREWLSIFDSKYLYRMNWFALWLNFRNQKYHKTNSISCDSNNSDQQEIKAHDTRQSHDAIQSTLVLMTNQYSCSSRNQYSSVFLGNSWMMSSRVFPSNLRSFRKSFSERRTLGPVKGTTLNTSFGSYSANASSSKSGSLSNPA